MELGKLEKIFKKYSMCNPDGKPSSKTISAITTVYRIRRNIFIMLETNDVTDLPKNILIRYLFLLKQIEILVIFLYCKDKSTTAASKELQKLLKNVKPKYGPHPAVEELKGGMNIFKTLIFPLLLSICAASGKVLTLVEEDSKEVGLPNQDFKHLLNPVEERRLAHGQQAHLALQELLTDKSTQVITFEPSSKYDVDSAIEGFINFMEEINEKLDVASRQVRESCISHAYRASDKGIRLVSSKYDKLQREVDRQIEDAGAVKMSEAAAGYVAYGVHGIYNLGQEVGKAVVGNKLEKKPVTDEQIRDFTNKAVLSLEKEAQLAVAGEFSDLENKYYLQHLCSFTPSPNYTVSRVGNNVNINVEFATPKLLELIVAHSTIIKDLEEAIKNETDSKKVSSLKNLMEQMIISERIFSSGHLFSGIVDPVIANSLNFDRKLGRFLADANFNSETYTSLVRQMMSVLPITNEEAEQAAVINKKLFELKLNEGKIFAEQLRQMSNVAGKVVTDAVKDLASGASDVGVEVLKNAGEIGKEGIKQVGDIANEGVEGINRIGNTLLEGPIFNVLLVAVGVVGLYVFVLVINLVYMAMKVKLSLPTAPRAHSDIVRARSSSKSPNDTKRGGSRKCKKSKKSRKNRK